MRDVDQVIERIRARHASVTVQQLKKSLPGDDDGLWFFQQPGSECTAQIESSSVMCPFLVETDESDERYRSKNIDETVELIADLLHINR